MRCVHFHPGVSLNGNVVVVFQESGQIQSSKTLACSGTCLRLLLPGTIDREGDALCWVFVYGLGGVSVYSCGKLSAGFETLKDDE